MALRSTDMIEKSCLECKKIFLTQYRNIFRGRGVFCSRKCSNKNPQTREKMRNKFEKTFKTHKFYKIVNKKLFHRIVMEKIIGRKLTSKEVVHHKDGNKNNNSPDNLELYSNNGEHLREHLLKNIGKCLIHGCNMEQKRKNMCFKHYARNKNHGSPYIVHKTNGEKHYVKV